MSKSLNSADILAAHFASAAGFTAVAGPARSRIVACKSGEEKTVESRLIDVNIEIDGEPHILKFDTFRKAIIAERWTESKEQAKKNAVVRAANAKKGADGASNDIPA